MQPPLPSLTPTWHNDIYPAIEYIAGDITHSGETIVITGAGSGLDRETALAFATAGAKQLVLMGRTVATLNETASLVSKVNDGLQVSVLAVDVTDEAAVAGAAAKIGTWNVLVHGAGSINTPVPASQADIGEYWKCYEVALCLFFTCVVRAVRETDAEFQTNVKSTILLAKYMISKASQANASFLAITAGISGFETGSGQDNRVPCPREPKHLLASIHPGMVDTKIFRTSGATPDIMPMDSPRLAAGFMLWVTKPDAKFLNGKTVWSNWDVTELKAMKESISASGKLNIGLVGWPFTTEKAA
ncbi:short chain dehydrogenase [Apiospora phragmitis]|uniref:Short chain dehydrogenase n=1 Tax=Apiospora phragmitis TaxID=2905665 RepID=A0ABR1TXV8_9PEZI